MGGHDQKVPSAPAVREGKGKAIMCKKACDKSASTYLTSHEHTLTHYTTPHHAAPHHTISHHTISYHTHRLHHTTLHYTTPYHTTPHHTTPRPAPIRAFPPCSCVYVHCTFDLCVCTLRLTHSVFFFIFLQSIARENSRQNETHATRTCCDGGTAFVRGRDAGSIEDALFCGFQTTTPGLD